MTDRRWVTVGHWLGPLALVLATGCAETDGAGSACPTERSLVTSFELAVQTHSVDLLLAIDDSGSMAANQANLARNFATLLDQLGSRSDRDMDGVPDGPPVRSLHVGVVSSDLGTPGSTVPSCANTDVGDDGLLNPIRNGQAIRSHQPWTTAMAGVRPARCTSDPNQYPNFLIFDAMTSNPAEFRDDFVCNAYLSSGGCGIEQQLESVYRALVVHNPREQAGNTDPNAGFVRPNAVLAIVMLSDEEDGSTRDCRYAESGVPCTDAIGVFDSTSGAWASTDLNLRFYLYTPGSAQDPTWNLDRYLDPRAPNRGFTSLKPGRPENVIFGAITGVPINLPQTASGATDYAALLGTRPDGSDGYTGMSPGGPISMRQRNMDPSCSSRVVPACRREGSANDPMRPACSTTDQYFAWPSRRIAEVARRFEATYHNGSVHSICRNDYAAALTAIGERIQQRLTARCLPRVLATASPVCCDATRLPLGCATGPLCADPSARSVACVVRETLPSTIDPAAWCTAAHGRRLAPDRAGRPECLVDQVAVRRGAPPPTGVHGFYYDTSFDPAKPGCTQRVAFTPGDAVPVGGSATLDCAPRQTSPAPGVCGTRAVGESCSPQRLMNLPCSPRDGSTAGCFVGTETYLESASPDCRSGACLVDHYAEATDPAGAARASHVYCSCRCAVPDALASTVDPRSLCTCGTGFTCTPVAGAATDPAVRGSYCVRTGTVTP